MPQLLTLSVFHGPVEVAAAFAVFLVSSTVYVLFGFGANLIAVGFLALFLPVQDVVVLVLFTHLPIELTLLARSWRALSWRRITMLGAGVVACIPVGTYLLGIANATVVLGILGSMLSVAGLALVVDPHRPAMGRSKLRDFGVGSLSGLLSGMLGVGGPPLIVYLQMARVPKTAFRGALVAVFQLTTWTRTVSYAVGGLITGPRLVSVLMVVPAVALGVVIGERLHLGLSEERFRRLVSIAFILLGIGLVGRAFTQWLTAG